MVIFKGIAGAVAGFTTLVAFLFGGDIVSSYLLAAQASLMAISAWQALEIISTLLAPIIVAALTAFGKWLYELNNRVNHLEAERTKHSQTLYGDDQDAMNTGLSREVADLKASVESVERMLTKVDRKIDRLEDSGDDSDSSDSDS